MSVWFEAAWAFTTDKSGTTAAHLHRVLTAGSYPTVWAMLGRFRSLMAQTGTPLGGPGVVVEVDETFLGGPRPGKRGRGADGKTMVVGAVEVPAGRKGFGRMRFAVIEGATSTTLRGFITANIAAGSTVRTDALNSYPGALDGYAHERINVKGSAQPAHDLLPAVHRVFSQVKRWLDGIYQGGVQPEHLQEYLDEYVFRFNRRTCSHRDLLFYRLLQRAVTASPVTYRDLVRVGAPKTSKPEPPKGRSTPGTLDVEHAGRPWRRPRLENPGHSHE